MTERRNWVRRWLAQKICPDLHMESLRHLRMRFQMRSDIQWLQAEFPDVAAALQRTLDNDTDWARALDELPVGTLPADISDFREYLRRSTTRRAT